MTKKNVLLKLLVFCSAICMALCAFTFMPKQTLATTDLPSVSTIYMSEGAEVRLKSTDGEYKDVTGIRFTMLVNKDYYDELTDSKLTIYVDEATVKTEADMKDSAKASTSRFTYNCEKLVTHAAGEKAQEAVYSFNAVVAGLPSENFGTKLIANGCIKVGNSEPVFATNPQTRSISQVASSALADNIADDEFGTLKSYVDGAVDVSNFKFGNTSITTDLYKTAEPTVNATIPENLTPIWTSSDTEVATVNQNGEITRGEKLGTTTITAKLGTIIRTATVTVDAPNVIKVDSGNYKKFKINNDTSLWGYVDSTAMTDFTGETYTGNASAAYPTASYTVGYTIENKYTLSELNEIAKDYNTVSLYYSVNFGESSGSVNMLATFSGLPDNFLNKATGSAIGLTNAKNKVWSKLSISMSDYIELATESQGVAKSKVVLFGMGTPSGLDANTSKIYIGDIVFEEIAPYVVKISTDTSSRFKLNGSTTSHVGVVDASADGLSGDYVGMAQKFKATNCASSGAGWTITNPFTSEELLEIKEKYNKVSLWFAYKFSDSEEGTVGNGVYITGKGTGGYASFADNFFSYAKNCTRIKTSSSTHGSWKKLTISVDEYIALATKNDAVDVDNTVLLLGMNTNGSGLDLNNSFIYIGDIFFENV